MINPLHPFALILAIVTLLAGCANSEAEKRSAELARLVHDRQIEEFVETFAARVPSRAKTLAAERVRPASIEAHLDLEPTTPGDVADLLPTVRSLYAERLYRPVFVQNGEITEQGRVVLRALVEAPKLGFEPSAFGAAELVALAARLDADDERERHELALALTPEDQASLLAFMMGHAGLDGTLPPADAVFAVVAEPGATNPVPRIAGAIDALSAHLSDREEAAVELEVALARGFFDYAIELRHGNLGYVTPELASENGWSLNDASQHRQIAATLAARSFVDGVERGFDAVIAELPPPYEQFRRLVAGLEEYQGYVDRGGWDPLEFESPLKLGDSGAEVLALRRRLAAENYFAGPTGDPSFDEALDSAVRHYQQTHQLAEDGVVSGVTLYSLNVPAERRLAQVYAGLEFWRHTQRAHDADREHIWVNIPDFHAELWEGSTLVHRWRVIVGREIGPARTGGHVRGRTPQFSDRLQYIVFNPYWNVPQQIKAEEYDHLIEADPLWLENNGFEIVQDGQSEWLRQLPGPDNALGRVKFLFPNEHDVYMHDTPTKHLFARPTRSFSHGCVRVQDPLLLANVLLRRDRNWSESRTDRYIREKLETEGEQWVSLIRPIPIHLEYVSVRGGDHGRIEFLADPYRQDRPRVDEWERRLGFEHSED